MKNPNILLLTDEDKTFLRECGIAPDVHVICGACASENVISAGNGRKFACWRCKELLNK